jgi:hypothetical protein
MQRKTTLRTGIKPRRREPTQRQLDALRPTQFRPGQSGNAGGRPRKTPITDALRSLMDQEYSGSEKRFKGLSNCSVIALTLFDMAIAGDLRAIQEIADRVEGKVAQRQEFCGPDGDPILWGGYASRAEAEERLQFLLSKVALTNSSTGEKDRDHVN